MLEIQVLTAWLSAMARGLKGARDDEAERGDVAQTVILVAILAAGAIAIATIIVTKFTGKANSIPTG